MERDNASARTSPHTDQFLLWSAFLLLLAAAFLMYVSLREERARLAGLEKVQADRQADFERIEVARKQGQQILGRFHGDDEFVRDQARERLGIAAPDEVVIRIESGAAGAPGKSGGPLFAPRARRHLWHTLTPLRLPPGRSSGVIHAWLRSSRLLGEVGSLPARAHLCSALASRYPMTNGSPYLISLARVPMPRCWLRSVF